MRESSSSLSALRRRIAAIETRRDGTKAVPFTLGIESIPALERGRLHEVYAAEAADGPSAAGFALMLAARAGAGPLLWLRADRGAGLHAPGLAELGVDPARLILVVAPDERLLLGAAADALCCAGLGAVLVETARPLDLTQSRRLALAAEQSGVTALLLPGASAPVSSAAQTRWRVAAAASTPLAANAPGGATFDISLLRHRAGREGLGWRVEWDRDRQAFRPSFEGSPPLSGAVPALSPGRPAVRHERAA